MLAGGLYAPEPEQLARFRRAIDRDATQFKGITSTKSFLETFGAIRGERLKTAPQGYDRSHPEIELLQLKQVTVAPFRTRRCYRRISRPGGGCLPGDEAIPRLLDGTIL
jgi:uncharacterized protein (DUF2461 family)